MYRNHKDRMVIINEPKKASTYAVYRVTLTTNEGHKTYIGQTSLGVRKRAQRHANQPGRAVYNEFHKDPSTLMIVEHLASARSKTHARQLEQQHIKRELKRVGDNLLNVQHTKKK